MQYGLFFKSFPFLYWISRYFTKYAFQTIMVYNVFQLSFKLKGSIRGKLFSIIWDTECCLLVSSQHLVTIRKSLWLPFRLSDYKTRQFPTNFILRVFLHYLFVRCNPNGNLWEHNKNVRPIIYKHRVSYNQLYIATAEFPRIKLKSEIVYNITISILH